MTIAIDVSRAVNESAGVGRFTRELVKNLIKVDRENNYLLLANFIRGTKKKEKILKTFEAKNVKIKITKMPGKIKEKIVQSRMPLARKMLEDADIYLAPTFLDYIWNLKIPQVVVIHDLTDFIFPEHQSKKISSYYQKLITQACKKAKKIISVSQSTKNDIVKILKVSKNKIEVVYPGLNDFPVPNAKLPAGLQKNAYILFVGTISPRKNLIGLFKAYSLLPLKLQAQYPLVIVGARGWNTGEIYEIFEALNLKDKVKILGFVTDSQLARLYKDTALFVYPSLYEGFGLPVLEALNFSAPVITSNISSLPEVAGKAGKLIDPNDSNEISKAMQELLEHENEIKNYRKEIKNQLDKFSWEISAKKTLGLLENLKN